MKPRKRTKALGLCVLVLAGAALVGAATGIENDGKDGASSRPGRPTPVLGDDGQPPGFTVIGERVLVSTPNHRVSEFMVAVNPNDPQHLVVTAMDWDDASGGTACAAYVSRDGGRTWITSARIPGQDAPTSRWDPWAAVGPDGVAHLTCITPTSTHPFALAHTRSGDGGLTWAPLRDIPAAAPGNYRDKEAMLVTPTGRLIVCVNDYPTTASTDDDLWVYRSDDNGQSWLPPINLEADQGGSGRGHCPDIALGAGGEIYAGHMTVRFTGPSLTEFVQEYGTVASYDNGDSWKPAVVAGSNYFGENLARRFFGAPPTEPSPATAVVAASPASGTVLMAMAHFNDGTQLWEPRLHRSPDQGHSYAEVQVPAVQSPTCGICHASKLNLAFDDEGRLALQLLLSSLDGIHREVWLLASADEGDAWGDPVRVAAADLAASYANPLTWAPHDLGAGFRALSDAVQRQETGGPSAYLLHKEPRSSDRHLRWGGDYWDFTATPDGFLAMWIDHYNGYPQIWARQVEVTTE